MKVPSEGMWAGNVHGRAGARFSDGKADAWRAERCASAIRPAAAAGSERMQPAFVW